MVEGFLVPLLPLLHALTCPILIVVLCIARFPWIGQAPTIQAGVSPWRRERSHHHGDDPRSMFSPVHTRLLFNFLRTKSRPRKSGRSSLVQFFATSSSLNDHTTPSLICKTSCIRTSADVGSLSLSERMTWTPLSLPSGTKRVRLKISSSCRCRNSKHTLQKS